MMMYIIHLSTAAETDSFDDNLSNKSTNESNQWSLYIHEQPACVNIVIRRNRVQHLIIV